MNHHSEILCFFIGLNWSLSGAMALMAFVLYDQNRLSPEPHYQRFVASTFLFGFATAVFIVHEFLT